MKLWVLSSSVLILTVVGLRALLRGKIAPKLQYALWLLVLLRLLFPFSPVESPMSVAYVLPAAENTVQNVSVTPSAVENPEVETLFSRETQISRPVSPAEASDPTVIVQDIWYIGMILVGLVLLGSNLVFYSRLRRSRKRLELDFPLPVYGVAAIPSPCLFGRSVYVPVAYLDDPQAMEHMLAHELCHHRQGDTIWSFLRTVCLVLHWYNPLVWAAVILSKADGELACDSAAIARLGEEQRIPYGKTLLGLITARPRPADLFSCATTMTSGKRSLQNRVRAIAKKPKMLVITAIFVALAMIFAVGCTFTGPEKAEEPLRGRDLVDIEMLSQADNGMITSPISSRLPPPLTQEQISEVIDLFGDMELTPASEEQDFASLLHVGLNRGDENLLSFFIDKNGVFSVLNLDAPVYYQCEDGKSVYLRLQSIMADHTDEQLLVDAFFQGLTYDADQDRFYLPEVPAGMEDRWLLRLDGRLLMGDTGSGMSYHWEELYSETDGTLPTDVTVSRLTGAMLSVTLLDESGQTQYVNPYPLQLLSLVPPTVLPT